MKVVAPSNAYDAKGLMTAAIRDNSPVIYLFHKGLQGMGWLGTEPAAINQVPEENYALEIGKAKTVVEGTDITIVSIGIGVHHALKAAQELKQKNISVEVVDLRSLVPLDRDHIIASVKNTGRLLVVDEDYHSFGVSGEVIASVTEYDHSMLKTPPCRITFPDIPIPFSRPMEQWALPSTDKIIKACLTMMESK